MLWQAAGPRRDGHAGCRLLRRSSCFQAGLIFRTAGFFTKAAGAAENLPRNHFSPTPQGGFHTPWDGSYIAASTKAAPAAPAETANEDRPLTLSALFLRLVLGGSPVEAAYAPASWPDQHGNNLVLQHHCTLCTVQSLYISHYVYSNKPVLS